MFDILRRDEASKLVRTPRQRTAWQARRSGRPSGCWFEPLEPRLLLSVSVFSDYVELDVAPRPDGAIVVDINNDGHDDIITANVGDRPAPPIPPEFEFSSTISVLLGNGDGTFAQSLEFEAGEEPLRLVAGYFNDDEWLDLAVTNGKSQSSITILLGKLDSQNPNEWDGFESPGGWIVRACDAQPGKMPGLRPRLAVA